VPVADVSPERRDRDDDGRPDHHTDAGGAADDGGPARHHG
jgi:hypothetical protein